MVLELNGVKLDNENIYNQYLIDLYIPGTGDEEIRKAYFAQGFKCGPKGRVGKLVVYVDDFADGKDPVPEVKLSVRDYYGKRNLEIGIRANKDDNARVNLKHGIDVSNIQVLAKRVELGILIV